jgi:hypothetical protein
MILIISNDTKRAESYVSSLGYMGYIAEAVEAKYAQHRFCPSVHACVLADLNDSRECAALCLSIRENSPDIPIFALCPSVQLLPSAVTLPTGITAPDLIKALRVPNSKIGRYNGAGLDLDPSSIEPTYFLDPISLTHTELQILRFLLLYFPFAQSAERIVKYCFNPHKRPMPSSIRAHISKINKIFNASYGHPIIKALVGVGYTLIPPEEF